MKYTNNLNVNQICSVEKIINKRNNHYIYKKYKKRRFWKDVKEGFYYDNWWDKPYHLEISEILEDNRLCVKDNVVYYKPYVIITMNNKEEYVKYFNTIEELEFFLKSEPLKYIVEQKIIIENND